MNYAKFAEVKQAWSHMLLNLHRNFLQTKGRLVQMVDQNGGKFVVFKGERKAITQFLKSRSYEST